MQKREFDVIVVGGGPGGYVAAIRAAQLGLKVACIDKRDTLGGTCLNVGCIPSKALLQSTEIYGFFEKHAKDHGIEAKAVSIDFGHMMQRKEGIVGTLVDSIAAHFKKHKITWAKGVARFVNPHSVEIISEEGKITIEADNIIIATGSEPIALPFLPFNEEQVVSSTGALSLSAPPQRLVVIGAGAIGLELASVYQRLGSQTAVVEMLDRVAPAMDQSISHQLLKVLKKQGVEFYLGAKVIAASASVTDLSIDIEYEQKLLKLDADVVLVAVGRRPVTQELGLEGVGVDMNVKGFIEIDGNFRTSQPNIYAIGDVIEGPMLAHKASSEGIAAAEIIAGKQPHLNYMSIPNVIYTHPEAASVGLTEAEAKEAGLSVKVGTSYFKGNARARCIGDMDGFVKVIGEATSRRVIGIHIIGPQASEMIGEGVIAIEKNATLENLANACHAHPTLSEAIMEACQGALGRAIHG
jgi:dihydrolipoamide dehydrogenase